MPAKKWHSNDPAMKGNNCNNHNTSFLHTPFFSQWTPFTGSVNSPATDGKNSDSNTPKSVERHSLYFISSRLATSFVLLCIAVMKVRTSHYIPAEIHKNVA